MSGRLRFAERRERLVEPREGAPAAVGTLQRRRSRSRAAAARDAMCGERRRGPGAAAGGLVRSGRGRDALGRHPRERLASWCSPRSSNGPIGVATFRRCSRSWNRAPCGSWVPLASGVTLANFTRQRSSVALPAATLRMSRDGPSRNGHSDGHTLCRKLAGRPQRVLVLETGPLRSNAPDTSSWLRRPARRSPPCRGRRQGGS